MMFRNQDGAVDVVSILGVALILSGIISISNLAWIVHPYYERLLTNLMLISIGTWAVFILAGIVALASKRCEFSIRIAIVTLMLGIVFAFLNRHFTEFYDYTSFLVLIVSFFTGVVVIASSLALICGYSHYSTKLFWCMGAMIVMSMYPIWYLYNELVPIRLIIEFDYYEIPPMICYAIVMLALHQESIRIPPVTEKIDNNLGIVKDMIYSDGETYITPEDADRLRSFIGSSETGHVDAVLRSGRSERLLSVTREDERTVLEIVPESGRSLMDGFRFCVNQLTDVDDCTIRIYGGPGVFIQIIVHPTPPKKDLKAGLARMKRKGSE